MLSASGVGVRLPAVAGAAGVIAPPIRILVSEDNPGIQHIYSRILPQYGFELVCVPGGDGQITVELARSIRPQLLITDINKPAMDGHQLLAVLRADPRTAGIPVLMVTAMDLRGEARRSGLAPADDYIVKPFLFEDLLYRMATMIDWAVGARAVLLDRAVGLPCYEHHHPATGLPCLHRLGAALPASTARPGWAAVEVSFANHRALVGTYGRPMVDGFAGRLGSAIRRAAGPDLLVGHTGFDLRVAIVGPAAQVEAAIQNLLAQLASLIRPRTILLDAPIVQLALRRADDRSGLGLSLPRLWTALETTDGH